MTLFKNKYRVESVRLKGWDYSSPAAYFITVVTKNRECYFGDIKDGRMHLTKSGEISKHCFKQIPNHFPFVSLDDFVIMPNHVHGILFIKKRNRNRSVVETLHGVDTLDSVETLHATSLPMKGKTPGLKRVSTKKNNTMSSIAPEKGSLSTIIRSFKSAVTRTSRLFNPDFEWQSRYHDHIIRDEKTLNKIRQYIIQNPLNWYLDENNPNREMNN